MTLDITGMVLAGGRGSRMGGIDKGLQLYQGQPLALHALARLRAGGQCRQFMVNANRNLAAYEAFGVPVWPDALPDHAGPLAGFLAGLAHCSTPYLVTVPCDSPRLPLDLVERLAAALVRESAEIAMACAPEQDAQGRWQLWPQPVFCLLTASLQGSLLSFTGKGGRKIDQWTRLHRTVLVPFDHPHDDRTAFFNANSLADLQHLELLGP